MTCQLMLAEMYEDQEKAYLFDETYHLVASLPYLLELLRLPVNRLRTMADDSVWMVLYPKLLDGF